jgi:hypothetical protein
MCALCGVLGGKDHWTDPVRREGVYVRHADPAARRRERARRIAAANLTLGLFGLTLSDWQADSYLLATRTGKTEVVSDLAALWPTAEKLAGRGLDPLDEDVIAKRERLHG